MELTLPQVQESLMRLVSHYPEAGHTGATLRVIASDYFEDLTEDRTSQEEFLQVVKLARRRCSFFPKVSDIIKLRDEIRANPPKKPVAGLIEEEAWVDTPEANAARIFAKKVVAVMLDKGISDTEAREIVLAEEKPRPQLRVVGQ